MRYFTVAEELLEYLTIMRSPVNKQPCIANFGKRPQTPAPAAPMLNVPAEPA